MFLFLIPYSETQSKKLPHTVVSPKVFRAKINYSQESVTQSAEPTISNDLTDTLKKPHKLQKDYIPNKAKQASKKKVQKNLPAMKPSPKPIKAAPDKSEIAMLLKKLAPKPFKYRPQGKVDPFIPLISKKKKTKTTTGDTTDANIKRPPKKRDRILTLLEKFDLSQLKLTAVMATSENAMAIVEDSSGRGFVVKTGTRIGLNSGRVVDILMDRIIVQESEEVITGKKLYVTKEIKLNKPDSEF